MATDGISTTRSAQTESAFRPESAAAALPLRTAPKAFATRIRSAVWVLPDRNVRPRPSAAPNSAIPGQPLAPSTANWEVHARLPTTAGLEDATIASARSSLWINLVQGTRSALVDGANGGRSRPVQKLSRSAALLLQDTPAPHRPTVAQARVLLPMVREKARVK
ncbi:hypothetical protein CF326_g8911 [Tilletia indica]|nr:hypothetical protein CF326_g8911 [Tilletia indica]